MSASLEAACDLRIGQVGVGTLKLQRFDLAAIKAEMTAKVQTAPQLLQRAPVIVDLNTFSDLPGSTAVSELLQTLRQAGVLPVGLTYGSPAVEALSVELGLPLFSRFRANYEPASPTAPAEPAKSTAAATVDTVPANAPPAQRSEPAAPAVGFRLSLHEGHVRSGQQIYARGQDLTILGNVGPGAEVIADGNIHIYGSLRGRALAGAGGEQRARVFCREFRAELVAVAGNYRVLDDAPVELHGKALQVRLDGERLLFDPLS